MRVQMAFSLDPPSPPEKQGDPYVPGNKVLLDILKNKAQKGVDVRILGFVNPALMNSFIAERFDSGKAYLVTNVSTIKSIDALRQEPTLTKKACLNIIGHTAGAEHVKMVVLRMLRKLGDLLVGLILSTRVIQSFDGMMSKR